MSIENFFTIQNLAHPQGGKGSAVGNSQAFNGESPQGLAFLDFILAKLDQAGDAANQKAVENANEHSALQSDNPALEKNPKLDLAKILAANPEIEEELSDFIKATGLGPDTALTQVLALNQKAFDDVLKPLTGGIITSEEIAKGSPRILQALLIESDESGEAFISKINEIKTRLQKLIQSGEGALITTNLTPAELNAIQNLPDNVAGGFDFKAALKEAGVPQELIDKTSIVLIKFVAPKTDAVSQSAELSDDPAVQSVLALFIQPAQKNNNGGVQTAADAAANSTAQNQSPESIMAARLNALNVGGGREATFTLEEYNGDLQTGAKAGKAGEKPNFDALLNAAGGKPPAPSADLSMLQGFPFTTSEGAMMAPFAMSPALMEEFGLSAPSNASITMAGLTSAITQAHSATAAHPATQMVALNIQKMAGNGESKTLMLQLDPPELGRVQVKLEFGHDKSLKTVVTAEKPETFLMLQRDSHALERALSEAGLDADGGLSFELAEQGFDFDGDNSRGGGHDQGGTGSGDVDGEIIESTMTWHVDTETGHTRYDILA